MRRVTESMQQHRLGSCNERGGEVRLCEGAERGWQQQQHTHSSSSREQHMQAITC